MSDTVLFERDGEVVMLTMSNPGRRNAFNLEMRDELIRIFTELQTDERCRAIVLTGAGSDFSSGGDLKGFEHSSINETRARLKAGSSRLMRLIVAGAKPVIAAVEGHAIGAGLALAAACDYVVAARDAKLCCAFIRMAFVPDLAGLWSLPRRVGLGKAKKLIVLGTTIDGAEAERIGLVDELAEPGQALSVARQLAAQFAAAPPLALEYVKSALSEGLEEVLKTEADYQSVLLLSEDHAEGKAAFFEKRKPNFTGN